MKKITIYFLLLFCVVLHSCDKDVDVIRGQEALISDIFANIEGSGPKRMFEPRYSNDTIYFDLPYYYPTDSDYETDLQKIFLRATVSSDAKISVPFGQAMDLTKPLVFSVTSGSGIEKKYTISAKKVGDVSISEARITYMQGGEQQAIDGILVNDEIRFFALPGLDMSSSIFTFKLNKHATSSIESGALINLNTPTVFTVSAPGNTKKDYKLVVMEPIKLPYGFGINRGLWLKEGSEWGFAGDAESCIAVSGDYLIITRSGTAGSTEYRIFNRFTGEFVSNMYMPFNQASGALSQSNQLVADEKGNLLAINRAPWGGNIRIYKYTDPFDTNPVLLINATNNNPLLTVEDRSTGRRLNITGDLNGNAIITSPVSRTKSFYRWEIKNGVLTSQTPTLVTMSGFTGSNIGYYPEVHYLNPTITSNYLLGQQNDFSYMDGLTNNQLNAVSLQNRTNTTFMNAIAIGRFNNAIYTFLGRYFSNYTLRRMGLSMFDITNPVMLSTANSSSQYPTFNVFNSETLISPLSTTGPGTGDIAVGYSHGGDRMQVYMLHTGYGIWAHEFTVYSEK
ncbi:DUF5018 domain-containing protein [Sphingobacterium tabacisoli]|uniref:DUF5018 domain-containing protein n=1 Tax=Sphingobacterium tabacisoli TaxID=2044855 RepID=A0ABW5L5A0_9SPHI|nr:DUF5018 domain-containing protein [Sphingobacterium tabacisoli]